MGSSKKHKDKDREHKHKRRRHRSRSTSRSKERHSKRKERRENKHDKNEDRYYEGHSQSTIKSAVVQEVDFGKILHVNEAENRTLFSTFSFLISEFLLLFIYYFLKLH